MMWAAIILSTAALLMLAGAALIVDAGLQYVKVLRAGDRPRPR
jgi:hypothetical protein